MAGKWMSYYKEQYALEVVKNSEPSKMQAYWAMCVCRESLLHTTKEMKKTILRLEAVKEGLENPRKKSKNSDSGVSSEVLEFTQDKIKKILEEFNDYHEKLTETSVMISNVRGYFQANLKAAGAGFGRADPIKPDEKLLTEYEKIWQKSQPPPRQEACKDMPGPANAQVGRAAAASPIPVPPGTTDDQERAPTPVDGRQSRARESTLPIEHDEEEGEICQEEAGGSLEYSNDSFPMNTWPGPNGTGRVGP
jgi:hypothetical protein